MKTYVRPMPPLGGCGAEPTSSSCCAEFTSVFVAAYLVLFLVMIHRLASGTSGV